MAGARRRIRAHETALTAYRAAVESWRIPLVVPEEPTPPRIMAVYGDPVFDSACMYDIKSKLSKLDGMACVYAREADGMRGQSSEARVSGSSERASLSPTIEDLDELDGWLRDWRATYLGVPTMARQGSLSDSISLGTAWLVARVAGILANRDLAVDFGKEVLSWHARLARFDPSDVVVQRKPARCDSCHGLTLEWRQGDDKVRCRMTDCGRVLLLDEYDALAEEQSKTALAAS
jgi:hypothetical protein